MKVGRAAQSFPYGIIALEIVELPLITAEQKTNARVCRIGSSQLSGEEQ
jgi:hypothetical protein